jgi:histidine triad (HIT) family protein
VARAARPCPFCAILRGEAEATVVWEDEATLAFLDRAPLTHGHVLLIPKAHVGTIWEADEAVAEALARAARRLALAVKTAVGADGSFTAQNNVVSQSVPHLHVHIVPRREGDGFFSPRIVWRRVRYRDAGQAAEIAARIRGSLETG